MALAFSSTRFVRAAALVAGWILLPAAARADCPSGYSDNGATCFRGADTQSNGGSRAADCPSGYTNTGLTCLRNADTIAHGSHVADCPPGFTNTGLTCYKGPDSYGKGCTTVFKKHPCRPGYTDMGCFCMSHAQSLGTSAMGCPSGYFLNRGLGRCYFNCPAGYTNTGETCYRGPDTNGADKMTCHADEFFSVGRCYKPCQVGYTNTGATCFRPASTLPNRSDITWNAPQSVAGSRVYNIAHMVNTNDSVDWAVAQGANGLEMDIHFDTTTGEPKEFRHGGICDCSCQVSPASDHVCAHLGNSCEAKSDAVNHLNHIATKQGIGFVYMDSKVDKDKLSSSVQTLAGKAMVKKLESALFDKGYQGVALISAPGSDYVDYLKGAVEQAKTSRYQDRLYFGIDMDNGGKSGAEGTISKLQSNLGDVRLIYGSGMSSCIPSTFYSETTAGVSAQAAGKVHQTNIWSIDLESTIQLYAGIGARGLLTNRPGVQLKVIKEKGLTLATPDYRP
jgi:hypothetical protein